MTESTTPSQGQADAKQPKKNGVWWAITSAARWGAALFVAILALLATRHDVCHLTTTSMTGLAATSPLPHTETTSTCGGVGFSDLTGYFLVILILLLPDAKSVGLGGFRFERLSSKLEEVSKEVGTLSQNLNQTFNFGVDALNELRVGLRKQKADLDEVRDSLPPDERTTGQVALIDDVARRSDDASPTEIMYASITAATLIEEAKRVAEVAVSQSVAVSDSDVATAQDVHGLITRLLGREADIQSEAPGDQPDADA